MPSKPVVTQNGRLLGVEKRFFTLRVGQELWGNFEDVEKKIQCFSQNYSVQENCKFDIINGSIDSLWPWADHAW